MKSLSVSIEIHGATPVDQKIRFSVEDMSPDAKALAVTLLDAQIRLLERTREQVMLEAISEANQ